MTDTPEQIWMLTAFNVPDRLGGLVARYGFKPAQKNRTHWNKFFDPDATGAHDLARRVLTDLRNAGLRYQWKSLPKRPAHPARVGAINFGRHYSTPGGYRLKQKRR
jgi:hypothetical protein